MYSIVLMLAASGSVDLPERCRSCSCSCYGSCHGCYGSNGCCRSHGGHGGYGCSGCYGGWQGCYGGCHQGVPGHPVMDPKTKKTTGMAPATLIVFMPADATLTIDDRATSSTAAMRVFTTPPLSAGEHTYTLKAQVSRDGQIRTETRQVIVRGGEQTQVRFDVLQSVPGIAGR